LTAVRSDVPLELERIVDKALSKDPRDRYQSISDMIVDLKALRGPKTDSATVSQEAGSPRRARRARRPWLLAVIAAAVVVAGVAAWQFLGRNGATTERAATRDDRVSIAVLPLDNMSQSEDQEYIADGMTEALIAELAQIKALRVISRTSVMRFKNTTQSIPEIAAMLGVKTIIEGSVVQAGGRVRVTAQLIDAGTDEHLWAQSYERDMSDVLALQSDVARAIAGQVKVELTPGEQQRLESPSSVDPQAYDLYLQGRYHWNRRNPADLTRALELFERAVAIDPDWARGYVALANTHQVMAGWGLVAANVAFPLASENVNKALELDPHLGSAWASLAGLEDTWQWDRNRAEEYYRKAIDLEPNNSSTHQWYAEFLCTQGRFDEALEQIEMARLIDPLAMVVRTVKAWIHYYMGDYDVAIAECERLIEQDPGFTGTYNVLADACRHAGRNDRAAVVYARYYEASVPGAGRSIENAYRSSGMDGVIRVVISGKRQVYLAGEQYISPSSIAINFASIGEADSAMVWFDRAYETRAFPITYIAVTPDCEPIHDDPRFIDLLQRVHLDHVTPAYVRELQPNRRADG
jgi:TolB-like protein